MSVVKWLLVNKMLFRERDLEAQKISHNWLHEFPVRNLVRSHGHGVWGPRNYTPTRYEIAQTKFPKAVFWGPSALWLQGTETDEPETVWLALKNEARLPKSLDPSVFVIRSRNLERDVVEVRPEAGVITLRVHTFERARADVSRANFHRMLERAANREQFFVPRSGGLLSQELPRRRLWHPIPAPPDEWTVK